jgi:hypothetical protein
MTMADAANAGSNDRTSGPSTPGRRAGNTQVWDPFVRVFHWLLVAGFIVNYFELVREGKLAHQEARRRRRDPPGRAAAGAGADRDVTSGADARIGLGRLAEAHGGAALSGGTPRRPRHRGRCGAGRRGGDRRSGADGKRRAQPARERLAGVAAGATVRLVVAEDPPRLAVADHGPGLDPADLPELTGPFRRGPKGGSAGLALAIVAEAAKWLKAQLSLARTDEAGGATFSLTFPR